MCVCRGVGGVCSSVGMFVPLGGRRKGHRRWTCRGNRRDSRVGWQSRLGWLSGCRSRRLSQSVKRYREGGREGGTVRGGVVAVSIVRYPCTQFSNGPVQQRARPYNTVDTVNTVEYLPYGTTSSKVASVAWDGVAVRGLRILPKDNSGGERNGIVRKGHGGLDARTGTCSCQKGGDPPPSPSLSLSHPSIHEPLEDWIGMGSRMRQDLQ